MPSDIAAIDANRLASLWMGAPGGHAVTITGNNLHSAPPLLAMRNICKSFAGVAVLKNVTFEVRAGEIHALCGENGAGKSTLMKILAGIHQPDRGEIELAERTFNGFPSAHSAQLNGIGIVFQERSLFGSLTVAENIFAGRQPVNRWGVIDRRQLRDTAEFLLAKVAPEIPAEAPLAEISPAQQQMVEIAKALSLNAKVLILDEPTAALTEAETARLFSLMRQLKNSGTGIIYISHRLEEIFQLADRVTVLKDGVSQGTMPVAATDIDGLVRLMIGRDVEQYEATTTKNDRPVLLEVRDLNDPPASVGGKTLLRNLSFQVRSGEIVGFAGLAGAGRTETALSLFGVRPRAKGETWLDGKRIEIHSPAEAISAGLGYVSEDRKESGLFLDMSVRRNISAARLKHFGDWFFRDGQEATVALDFVRRLGVACHSVEQDTMHLSGGNQQKVLLARWLLLNPRILIVDEPTQGVDVGAKAEIHQLLREFARQDRAVIVISSDLPEILALSDRIYVMRTGQITGELSRHLATEEAIMHLAAANDSIRPTTSNHAA